jgi:hypothetical protein
MAVSEPYPENIGLYWEFYVWKFQCGANFDGVVILVFAGDSKGVLYFDRSPDRSSLGLIVTGRWFEFIALR